MKIIHTSLAAILTIMNVQTATATPYTPPQEFNAIECLPDERLPPEAWMAVSWFNLCHRFIADVTQENAAVLKQYKAFEKILKVVYRAGVGMIDKDILRILKATEFAADKHRHQVRKDAEATPYIIHPIRLANHLMTVGHVRDPDIIIGALLHDTVEDTETTFEEIEQRFGARVAGFVREVSDDKSLSKETRKQLQIEHAHEKSAGAAQIKLADKLDNLTCLLDAAPVGWETERVDAYFVWAQSVVDQLPWVNLSLKQAVDETISRYWENKKL